MPPLKSKISACHTKRHHESTTPHHNAGMTTSMALTGWKKNQNKKKSLKYSKQTNLPRIPGTGSWRTGGLPLWIFHCCAKEMRNNSFQVGKEELVQFLMSDGVGEGTEKGDKKEQGNHFFSPTYRGIDPWHHRGAFKKHILVFHLRGLLSWRPIPRILPCTSINILVFSTDTF